MVVTFDFDNTIAMSHTEFIDGKAKFVFENYNDVIIDKVKQHIQDGDEVYIVTARDKAKEGLFPKDNIPYHLKKLNLYEYFYPDRVFYTNDQPKLKILRKLGSEMHWDDKMEEIIALKRIGMKAKNPYDLLKDVLIVGKAFIFDADDRILVLERNDGINYWDFPGGHLKEIEVNRGEDGLVEGLLREVAEETGLILPNEKKIGSFSVEWKDETHEIVLFASKLSQKQPKVNLNLQDYQENLSYEWVTYEELLKMLPRSVNTVKKAVELFPKEQFLSIEEGKRLSWAKNHRKMKEKLIGLGLNKSTGGGAYTKKPNFNRSKSAPAGFGALEEDADVKKGQIKVKIGQKKTKITYIGHHSGEDWDSKWHDLKPKDGGKK